MSKKLEIKRGEGSTNALWVSEKTHMLVKVMAAQEKKTVDEIINEAFYQREINKK